MSAPIDVSAFMSDVGAYYDNERGLDEAGKLRLATVHAYDNNGLLLLVFDGEPSESAKGYSWVGPKPAEGRRVVVMPMGATSVVLGELNNDAMDQVNYLLGLMPQGLKSQSRLTAPSAYVRNQSFTTGATALKVQADLEGGRQYRVGCPQVNIATDTASTRVGASLRAGWYTLGTPSGERIMLQESQVFANNAFRHDSFPCMSRFAAPQRGTLILELVISTITPVGNVYGQSRIYAAEHMPCDLIIEDVGFSV